MCNTKAEPEEPRQRTGVETITPEEFDNHVRQMAYGMEDNLFTMRKAGEWLEMASNRPIPKMLFGALWFESEICILFADTNVGKSILAVQIGDSISKGECIKGFNLETEKQPELYFDFELTDKQFEVRYTATDGSHYQFDDQFYRAEINPDSVETDMTFEEYLNMSVEQAIIHTNARILIIDNITYLKNENEKARDALPLMKQLKALKTKYNLSILALAHTPKRDLGKPITKNDLQGSKMLMNFCDSSFALGESTMDKSQRYLKQIKARNCQIVFDTENVGIFEIIKPDNYLHFNYTGTGNEFEHLKVYSAEEVSEFELKVLDMMTETPDISAYAIAKELCPHPSKLKSFNVKVSRIMKKLKEPNEAEL